MDEMWFECRFNPGKELCSPWGAVQGGYVTAMLDEAMSIADADKRREVMAKIEKLMQDEGVIIQPYWRSLYRHFTDKVKGCDMHPTFEHHHYKWWMTS